MKTDQETRQSRTRQNTQATDRRIRAWNDKRTANRRTRKGAYTIS